MSDNSFSSLGLDDLIESDMTSYELYSGLPAEVKRKVRQRDASSFDELNSCAAEARKSRPGQKG